MQHDILMHPKRVKDAISKIFDDLAPNYAWLLSDKMVTYRFYEGLQLAALRYPDSNIFERETFATQRFYLGDRFDEHPEFNNLVATNSLGNAINKFMQKYQADEKALAKYKTKGWLGIEGRATLTPN